VVPASTSIPVLPSPPSLPAQASIVPIDESHIPALRRINALLLPVAYPDSFYARALDPQASGLFSRVILWQESPSEAPKVIGGVVCRLEPATTLDPTADPRRPAQQPNTETAPSHYVIYIQSLALLSPYRTLGLAAAALEHIIASAVLLPAANSSIDVRGIYAHVWTQNEEGLKWYAARGFQRVGDEPIQGYYFKLRPDTAWIVQRAIGSDVSPTPSKPGQWQTAWPSSTASPAPASKPLPSVSAAAVNLPPANSTGPPRRPSATPSSASSLSYQNTRPEVEWNDLPADMVNGPPSNGRLAPGSGQGSAASSRSSSAVRKKKDRAYPSAAFGN